MVNNANSQSTAATTTTEATPSSDITTTTAAPIAAPAPTPALIPNPPTLSAKGYVLMDANSGNIIAQKNANERMAPASLTKLMTLYIIADELQQGRIQLDDQVRISKKAWQMGGSRMFVKVGTKVPVKLLIQGIIVASGNDATYAMAEYIGGTEQAFVDLMNQTAKALGMTNTHFSDCNGLPKPDHYSTPMDLAKLTRAIIQNYPEYYHWFSQKWINYNNIKQPNRNRLLWRDPSVDGLKTGHTEEAGYCLISSAMRNGMRLISVVMGTPTDSARANESEALLTYGFRFFETHKLYDPNTAVMTPRVWFGQHKKVGLGLINGLYVTIPIGQYKNINVNTTLDGKLTAPITKGQQYGTVTVTLNGKPINTQPLVALSDDQKGGIVSRLIDHIAKLF
ncbi:MAG: D-alanyl-D-alanine carboxypeptidase [Gammaproteobacteria bacterium]|nr:D-alanyl-D-alanine carboxypeptidase [Gammaproteobacteria bacterium]